MQSDLLAGMKADFRQFLLALWKFHGLDKVAPLGPLELDIAAWLQHGHAFRGVLAFRELGKSMITNAYGCWRLWLDPKTKIVLLSDSQAFSKNNLNQIKTWIRTTPWLRHLAPRKGTKDRDGAIEFDVASSQFDVKNPSVVALGVEGQITGRRAHVIIGDDVETPNTSNTQVERQNLRKRLSEAPDIAYKKGGEIIYLGTPQHEETVYADLQTSGFIFRCWPILYPTAEEESRLAAPLAPFCRHLIDTGAALPGEPTCPHRFGMDIIIGVQSKGRSRFAMQYMLQKHLADANYYPLKLSDLLIFNCHRDKAPINIAWGQETNTGSTRIEGLRSVGFGMDGYYRPIMFDSTWLPYTSAKMYVDPAGKGKDETAWAIVAHLHGVLYLLHVGAYRGPSPAGDACLNLLVRDAQQWRVRHLVIETNFGGEAIIELLKPKLRAAVLPVGDDCPEGWACAIEGQHNTGMKEERIVYALQPVMNQHRLVVDRRVVELDAGVDQSYQLFHQMTRIIDPAMSGARGCLQHDDRLEAVAGAVALWQEALAQDPAHRQQQVNEEAQRKLIETWHGYGQPSEGGWINLN